jgi:hypothetical protein
VRIVVGTHALGLGGSETYAITLAEQLQRLGHEVWLTAFALQEGVAVARAHGIEAVAIDGPLPDSCDAIVAQDRATAFALAGRYAGVPLVFVAHSEEFDEQLPPVAEGLVRAVVVLNDRVERRIRALSGALEVVRLRQPIDVGLFRPRSRVDAAARRLLLFGNNIEGPRLDLVRSAASELGLEVVRVGSKGDATPDPVGAIDAADIVMGYGRCVLEAMACARAAYVYDHLGGDGWVTTETYAALESDGFGGRALPTTIDRERLVEDLRAYDAEMGIVNRDLVVAAHRAEHHAQQLLELLTARDAPQPTPATGLSELAGLVRAQWAADARIGQLERQRAELLDQLAAERASAAARHEALIESRRYRVGSMLARPLELIRRRRRARG